MRSHPNVRAEQIRHFPQGKPRVEADGRCGSFRFEAGGQRVHVVVSDKHGWDHVAVAALVTRGVAEPLEDNVREAIRVFFPDGEEPRQFDVPERIAHYPQVDRWVHLWRRQDASAPVDEPPLVDLWLFKDP